METIALVLFMLGLEPYRDERDLQFRIELAEAIVEAAPEDPHLQRLLASIAKWESRFNRDVATCKVKGDGGLALGSFQIHARSKDEISIACGSLEGSARLAASRVLESIRICQFMPKSERLSVYASGSCTNRGGRSASRLRWVD